MNDRRAAIAAELGRRGLLGPDGSERREAIRAELARRGLLQAGNTASEEVLQDSSSFWDRVKQFGRGIASGVTQAGMGMAAADPYVTMAQRATTQGAEAAEAYQNTLHQAQQEHAQQEAQELQDMDALGRILHKGGQWTGAGAAFPLPSGTLVRGATTLPRMLKNIGKNALKDASVGAASGVLQEGGMNPLAADLLSSVAVPGTIGIGKGVKKGAQYVLAPREQKTARTLNKIYAQKAPDMGETRPVHEAFNVPATLEELNPVTSPTEAGTQLRETLAQELKTRKDVREAQTKPLYKAVKENRSGFSTPETHRLINALLESNRGDTRKAVQDVQKELSRSHHRLTPAEIKNREQVERYLQDNPNVAASPSLMAEIRKAYPYREVTPTAHEVDKIIRQVIDPKLKTVDESLKRELLSIKESLLKETSSVPQLKEAREMFAELSKPVNKIERHPLLKLAVEKDDFNKSYKFGESDLPKKVIDPSLHSIHHAQDLLNEIKDHPQALAATKGYIHGHILDQITDGYGKVSHEKLQGWKRKNPGAFVIDPSLETKLKNLSNAQYLVNQARLKINNASLKDTFGHFGLKTGAKLLPSFVGKDKLVELLSFKLAEDIQGKDELILKLIQSPQFQQLLNTPLRQTSKMEKLVKALEPAMRNILIATQRSSSGDRN